MKISPSDIPLEVQNVAKTLENKGFEAYLVGGCTRDLFLGKTPKDWDLTTNAHPESIQELFPDHYFNNDFGTVGVKTDSEETTLKVIEVTPYRTEGTYSDARRPDQVSFGATLQEDLQRRDFTINALAYRITTEELVDEFNGISDLEAKRLQTVGDPDERISEDALRMMRAVRLAAELDFMIEQKTMEAIARHSEEINRISIERAASEFLRTITSATPMQGVIFLE